MGSQLSRLERGTHNAKVQGSTPYEPTNIKYIVLKGKIMGKSYSWRVEYCDKGGNERTGYVHAKTHSEAMKKAKCKYGTFVYIYNPEDKNIWKGDRS